MTKNNVNATTETNVTNMKPKGGTAKPSGNVGRGGSKTSPTDGKSLKPSGVKGGKMKKSGAINK